MADAGPVVVDTNILFSALLKPHSRFAEILLKSEYEFYACELVIVELFRHKERLVRASRLSPDVVVDVYYALLRQITIHREDLIPAEYLRDALRLCRGVDETDAPHVALALALDAPLWTGDQSLRRGLESRGFTRFFNPPI